MKESRQNNDAKRFDSIKNTYEGHFHDQSDQAPLTSSQMAIAYADHIACASHSHRHIDIIPLENTEFGKRHRLLNAFLFIFSGLWVVGWVDWYQGGTDIQFIISFFLYVMPCVIVIPVLYYLFKPFEAPIRFHRQHQKVYVYQNDVLYAIPLEQLEFEFEKTVYRLPNTSAETGEFGTAYYLKLVLDPKHAESSTIPIKQGNNVKIAYIQGEQSGLWVKRYADMLMHYMDDSHFFHSLRKDIEAVKNKSRDKEIIHRRSPLGWALISGYYFLYILYIFCGLPFFVVKLLNRFQHKITPRRRLPEVCH